VTVARPLVAPWLNPLRSRKPVRRRWPGRLLAGICAGVLAAASLPAPGAAPTVAWEPAIEVASGDARRGPWRMNESQYLYVDDPSVAIDAAGGIAVVWADQARQDIYFQSFGPDGRPRLEEPVNVSGSGEIFSWLPRLLVAGDEGQEVYVLWQEIVFSGGSHGGEIYFARSGDGGRSFSGPLNLSRTTAGAGKGRLDARYWHNGSLDLAYGPQGELYAAWTEYEGPLRFARSSNRGESFSAPLLVAGGEGELPARGPSLAVDEDGAIYVAWTVGEDPGADIHLARSNDGGRSFSAPRAVAAGPGHADGPKLAVGHGVLHLVYAESQGGPLQQYQLRYTRAQVPQAQLDFEAPRVVVDANDGASVAFPALGIDDDNNLYLLWERFPAARERPRGLGYSTSGDGGRSFSAPAVVPGSDDPALGFNGSLQGLLMQKLAVDGAGRVAVANSTYASGEASRIWLHHGQRR
jgi:hypothetical protein